MSIRIHKRASLLAAAAASILLPLGADGATYTWTASTTGTWADVNNWLDGIAPVESTPLNPTVIRFFASNATSVGASFTATNDVETSTTPDAFFDIEQLILSGTAGTSASTNRTVTLGPSGSTRRYNFTGTSNLIEFAPGGSELVYNVLNNITFQNGLEVLSSSSTAVGSSPTLPNRITGNITGSGGLTKTGTGRLSLDGSLSFSDGLTMNGGRLDISGNNNFSGGITLNSGTTVLGHDGALGTSLLTLNGGILSNSGLFSSGNPDTNSRDLSNKVVFGGDFQIMQTTIQTGNYSFSGTIDLGGETRVISIDAPTTGNQTSGSNVVFSNVISNGGLTKSGRAQLRLTSGNSSYTGVTTVRQGTLIVLNNAPAGANGALGNATSAVELGDSGTSEANTIRFFLSGAFEIGRDININNYNSTGITILGGIGDFDAVYSGNIALNRPVDLTSAAAGSNALTFSGDISGDHPVTIVGGGNVRFTTAKSYTGGTMITSGALTVDGSLATSNLIIGGTSTASLDGSGTLTYNLDDDVVDLIEVLDQGTLDISGLTLALDITGTQTQSQYVIADYTAAGATLMGSQFASVSGLGSAWTIDYGQSSPGQILLVAVPEPASLAGVAVGAMLLLPRMRRR